MKLHPNGEIRFHNDDSPYRLRDKSLLKVWLEHIATSHHRKLDSLDYVFCSSDRITEINIQYLDHHYPTDIITFNYNEGTSVAAEIYICPEVVKENASRFRTTFAQEMHRVLVHGLLHLLEFDDQTESQQKEMRQAEDDALAKLNEMFHVKQKK